MSYKLLSFIVKELLIQRSGSKMSLSSSEIHDILVGVGVEPEPKIERTPEKVNGIVDNVSFLCPFFIVTLMF